MFFGNSRIRFFFKSVSSIVINMERVNKKKEHNQHCSVFNVLSRSIANSIDFFYLVTKRLMITKNSVVKIRNLVVNHKSRPVKSTHAIRN